MSTFTSFMAATAPPLSADARSISIDPRGQMISATPAVVGGAAVVGSALIAYAVEEAGDQ